MRPYLGVSRLDLRALKSAFSAPRIWTVEAACLAKFKREPSKEIAWSLYHPAHFPIKRPLEAFGVTTLGTTFTNTPVAAVTHCQQSGRQHTAQRQTCSRRQGQPRHQDSKYVISNQVPFLYFILENEDTRHETNWKRLLPVLKRISRKLTRFQRQWRTRRSQDTFASSSFNLKSFLCTIIFSLF